jgi:hypothetical protein
MSPKVLRGVGILVIFAFCLATYQWGKWWGYSAGYAAGGGNETRYMARLSEPERHAHVLDVLCADHAAEGTGGRQACLDGLSAADRRLAEDAMAKMSALKPKQEATP